MKRLIISLAAIAALTSCIYEDDQTHAELVDVTISAGIDTKTVMSGESVAWESGDKVSLVFKSSSDAFVGEFTADIDNGTSAKATFLGGVATDVTGGNGYADAGLAVYPSTAVDAQTGEVSFVLPSEQYAKADGSGSFDQHLNLSSSVVSLADIKDDQHADANFRNALSVLRFNLSSDVESVVISTDKPLTGKPDALKISSEAGSEGRLLMDGSVWEEPSASVTLKPEEGNETFKNGVTYSVLIWPGTHSSLTVRVNFKDYSSYEKTLTQNIVFAPSKYYSLTLAGKDLIVNNITGRLDKVDGSLAEIKGRLDKIEGNQSSVDDILSQIQSVSLMSEYLDNASYAPYANYQGELEKQSIQLDYIIRPAAVAQELVDNITNGTVSVEDVFSAVLYYKNADGSVDISGDLTHLSVTDVTLNDDILTVNVDASGIKNEFYTAGNGADLALQIVSSDTKTALLSDFAKLVPIAASGITGNNIENIPVPAGVEAAITFSFTAAADSYDIVAVGTNVSSATVTHNKEYKKGYLNVGIREDVPVADQSVEVQIIAEDKTVLATKTFTFVDGGTLSITQDGPVDYIGGDLVVTVAQNDFVAGALTTHNANGTGVSQNGNIFSFDANPNSAARSATALYQITVSGSLKYNKYIDLVQYGTDTGLQRAYYTNNKNFMIQTASAGYQPLNIVILGDGFMLKDLSKGGKFEKAARTAAEVFFGIEPYKSYKNCFSVYVVANESNQEGTDIVSTGQTRDTYFDSQFNGGAVTSNETKIINVVKNVLGLNTDNKYYRTVVMLLVNTSENAGSCTYPVQGLSTVNVTGDGFASFSIATLAAFSSGTNGLIKHEVGGHAFGRLGDEYAQYWYDPDIINDRHLEGFYYNIATDISYWSKFTAAGYSIAYYNYMPGLYTSTKESGMMFSNTGSFNPVSRWAIYERIMKQTRGDGDYWNSFLSWDKRTNP